MPLALAAFESMGLGASWEGAAAPGVGWGQGHCPWGCWFPLPDFQPTSQSQLSRGRAVGRIAWHHTWEGLWEGEAGWDLVPSAVPGTWHVVPDVWCQCICLVLST